MSSERRYALIGHNHHPITDAEKTVGVTPTNLEYAPGNVLRYGTNTTPGTTDMTVAINRAIDVMAASGGGRVVTDEDLAIDTGNTITFSSTGGSVILDFCGHTVNVDIGASEIAIDIDGQGLGTANPKHQVINGHFQSSTAGNGTCIRIRDSQQQKVKHCEFHDFDKAIQLAINATSAFCESTVLHDIMFEGNNYMVHITRTGGNYSFASTYFSHLIGTTANAQATTAYGIYIDTDCSIYRAEFDQVVIFPAKSSSVAFYCNGIMRNAHGSLHIEGVNGAATGNVGFHFGSGATLCHADIFCDIRGTIADEFLIDTSEMVTGIRTSSLSTLNAEIVKNGVQSKVSAIADEDFSTFYFRKYVTSAGAIQYAYPSSTPFEFVDDSTGNLAPVRLLDVGNAEATAADGDTTPSVADITRLLFSQTTGATTVTDLDDGVDGQVVVCRFVQSTFATTIQHNVNIVLNGSANYTPANNHSTLTLMCYGGTVWREIGRMAT